MMTPKENVMAILNRTSPDKYIDIMDAVVLLPDPAMLEGRIPQDGKEYKNAWGVTYQWMPGAPGAHPHVTPENAVIKDIEHWRDTFKAPAYEGLDWSMAKEVAASVDRNEKLVCVMFGGGLFEMSHHLMGMEQAFMNYMEYPDEMTELLEEVAKYKIGYIYEMAKQVQPDIIFYHDDWGSKQNVFLPPRIWRQIIKPIQKRIADAIHDCGMIYMHHADCICQPIVEDMVEIGIDIWQGVIAQNDIPEIQRITEGKLAMVGGIDGPAIDIANITEEQIRAEVRRAFDTYCPAGRFFPSIPNGICFREWNNKIFMDEKDKYGFEYAKAHPQTLPPYPFKVPKINPELLK